MTCYLPTDNFINDVMKEIHLFNHANDNVYESRDLLISQVYNVCEIFNFNIDLSFPEIWAQGLLSLGGDNGVILLGACTVVHHAFFLPGII